MNVYSQKFHANRNIAKNIKFKIDESKTVQEFKAKNTFTLNFPLQALIYRTV